MKAEGIADHLKEMGSSLSELVEAHLALFKAELAEDGKKALLALAAVALGLPMVMVAWALLNAAGVVLLATVVPLAAACALFALVNVVLLGGLVALTSARLKTIFWLDDSKREASASAEVVTRAVRRATHA